MYDELIKWLWECASGECFNCSHKGNASCPDDLMKQAAAAIEELQKRKHGKWVFGFDEETGEQDLYAWTCSLCGEKYPWQPNFCPNCGADMREETEDIPMEYFESGGK